MGLETVVYVGDLNTANPTNLDRKKYGDDHFRALKTGLLGSFPGWTGIIAARGTEAQGASVNDYTLTLSPAPAAYTTGLYVFKATHTNTSAVTLQVNALGTKTLKDVDGNALAAGDIVSGSLVVAYYDGTDFFLVSGNDRADREGDTYTGTHDFTGGTLQLPTQTPGDNTTKGASTAFVQAAAFSAVLPSQTGNAGKLIGTDGATASWGTTINATVMSLADGTTPSKKAAFDLTGISAATTRTLIVPDANLTIVGTAIAQTLTNKTIVIADNAFTLQDNASPTKQAVFELSGITAGQTRTLTIQDQNILLENQGWKYLSTVTASNATSADIETTFDSTYDVYMIVATGISSETTAPALWCQMKISGAYQAGTNTYRYSYQQQSGTNTTSTADDSKIVLFPDVHTTGVDFAGGLALRVYNPAGTANYKAISWEGALFDTAGNPTALSGAGAYISTTGALTGIRIKMSASNINGTFRLYGLRNS